MAREHIAHRLIGRTGGAVEHLLVQLQQGRGKFQATRLLARLGQWRAQAQIAAEQLQDDQKRFKWLTADHQNQLQALIGCSVFTQRQGAGDQGSAGIQARHAQT